MSIRKIVTHGGKYHADELLAITILADYHNTEVENLNIKRIVHGENLDKYLDNSETYVLDIGGIFDPTQRNYDHHQNGGLAATCKLILTQFYDGLKLAELSKFVDYVSNIDVGINKPHTGDFNSIIADMSTIGVTFEQALAYTETTWAVVKKAAFQRIQTVKDLQLCPIDENYIINIYPYELPGWQDHVPTHVNFCIFKDGLTEDWGILAKNSDVLPVYPVGEPKFIHNNKFIAKFQTLAECIQTAQYSEQFLDAQPEPVLDYE